MLKVRVSACNLDFCLMLRAFSRFTRSCTPIWSTVCMGLRLFILTKPDSDKDEQYANPVWGNRRPRPFLQSAQ